MSLNDKKELLDASVNGDIKIVQSILEKKEIDINCKDVLIKKNS